MGGGRAFLLVHGLASNARLWDGVGAHLAAAGHTVVAVDQRGHGRSDRGSGDLTFPEVSADLVALSDALEMDRPLLVGQSWGGNVVIEAAGRHPDRFRGVAAVDGGFIALGRTHPDPDQAWAELAPPVLDDVSFDDLHQRMAAMMADFPDGAVEAQLANMRRLPGGGVRARLDRALHEQIVRDMWANDPVVSAARIQVPTLLLPVAGGEGRWARTKREGVRRLAEVIDDCAVLWMEGHHDIHLQKPDEVAELLLQLADRAA